jgi:hypothetical protein
MAEWFGVRPDRLVQRLVAIPDRRMRVIALVSGLAEGDPAEWVRALAQVLEIAHGGTTPDAAKALESITHAAGSEALPYAARQALYAAAVEAGRLEIARLFFSASPATVDARLVAKQKAPERPLERRGRPLSLGERRSLARTHRRDRLALIAKDPHPAVVAVLLTNPHVTEPDIVAIAASRSALPETLGLITDHPKWSASYAVKRALVQNPLTPLAAAIRIATTMTSHDLKEIAELSILAQPLREHAREVLLQRKRRSGSITLPS